MYGTEGACGALARREDDRHRHRGARLRLSRRARRLLPVMLLGAALLGAAVAPAGEMVAGLGRSAGAGIDRLDSALESLSRVDGYLRRYERRDLAGR